MADEQAAGTPGAGTDGAVTDSGTPNASQDGSGAATVDAEEIEKLRNIRDQFLREKDNTERIRQENEYLRQQVEQASRAATPPTGYDPAAQQAARLAQALQNVQERDPEVVELLTATARMTQEQFQRQAAQLRYERERDAVPAADRAEVERIARAENLWPSIAYDRVRAQRYDKERNDIAEQRRKIQEQEDKQKRGVVRTDAAPAPPASRSNEPSREDYAKTARLAAEGNAAAYKQMKEWDRREETEGPIKFRSD